MYFKDEQVSILIISLLKLKGVGNKIVRKFLEDNIDEISANENYEEKWLRKFGSKKIIQGLNQTFLPWDELQKKSADTVKKAYNVKIRIINPFMKAYPKRMLVLKNYPPILYGKGNIKLLNSTKIVTIVGTRNPTMMGVKVGTRLAEKLAQDGYTIVSGLAKGSDTVGHAGALNVKGYTIAVLPTPIDAPVYPKENRQLAEQILFNDGLLLSEYAPGVQLKGRELVNNLIARDEWQPALSDGLIAIETSVKGGTDHAIRHAIDTNKPIGILDYSSVIGPQFNTDERFSGNMKYLENKNAIPLFTEKSVHDFENIMKNYNQQIKKECFNRRNSNKIEPNASNSTQINLLI